MLAQLPAENRGSVVQGSYRQALAHFFDHCTCHRVRVFPAIRWGRDSQQAKLYVAFFIVSAKLTRSMKPVKLTRGRW